MTLLHLYKSAAAKRKCEQKSGASLRLGAKSRLAADCETSVISRSCQYWSLGLQMRMTEVHDDLAKEKDFLGQRVAVHNKKGKINHIEDDQVCGGGWRGN